MADQADHYEFLDELRQVLPDTTADMDEDELMDFERRLADAETYRDSLREDGSL